MSVQVASPSKLTVSSAKDIQTYKFARDFSDLQRLQSVPAQNTFKPQGKKRRASETREHTNKKRGQPPHKFYWGGNITDPLNLESLVAGEGTPEGSPGGSSDKYDYGIAVNIPLNPFDPLNLNSLDDIKAKPPKKRRPKPKKSVTFNEEVEIVPVEPAPSTVPFAKKCPQKDDKFIYGNYNRYYGKRNGEDNDIRLKSFPKTWFEKKDVLDIGCNIGHITLSIARDYAPRKIVGIDIDGQLISIARKNIPYYTKSNNEKKFPKSFPKLYGPLGNPGLLSDGEFPHNVVFMQANYVLDSDELLDMQHEEYDVIIALSITKWIHLNWGDDGIRRFFLRTYRHLRPGGMLILEPQPWASYKRKKKLTPNIQANFKSIRLRPANFPLYLTNTVGFLLCDTLHLTTNASKGFHRSLQLYMKPDASLTPANATESRGITPLMAAHYSPVHSTSEYSMSSL